MQFQFGTSTSYGSTTPITAIGSGLADVPVRIAVQALKPSTTYHFRAVALVSTANTATGVNGPPLSWARIRRLSPRTRRRRPRRRFPRPGIATAITPTGATLNGTVNPEGTGTGVRFEYGTDTTYGTATPPQSIGAARPMCRSRPSSPG